VKKVEIISGCLAYLDRANVDTDQIIPSDWLKKVERTGFGEALFSDWRGDPNFELNDPRYQGAKVLIARENFGIGSSREHAVWALSDYGFEAVISPKFADIFKNNCTKNGLLPVELAQDACAEIMNLVKTDPPIDIVIDVKNQTVEIDKLSKTFKFELDEFVVYRYVNGLDDIGLTLRHEDEIKSFETKRPSWLPALT
jgi:3-isopropylmalate/(R)-2-methylmalate dehydratase small subunit